MINQFAQEIVELKKSRNFYMEQLTEAEEAKGDNHATNVLVWQDGLTKNGAMHMALDAMIDRFKLNKKKLEERITELER